MSFYRDTIRTARKEHKCSLCQGVIKVGEKYHDKAGTSYGDDSQIYHGKECVPCQAVIREFMETADEGYNAEYINEWWRDAKCYDCKHRYLPCKPDDDCKNTCLQSDGFCRHKTIYDTCKGGDICDEMTHYCRCEKFEQEER